MNSIYKGNEMILEAYTDVDYAGSLYTTKRSKS